MGPADPPGLRECDRGKAEACQKPCLVQPGFPEDLLEQRIPDSSRAGRSGLWQAPACRDQERLLCPREEWASGCVDLASGKGRDEDPSCPSGLSPLPAPSCSAPPLKGGENTRVGGKSEQAERGSY